MNLPPSSIIAEPTATPPTQVQRFSKTQRLLIPSEFQFVFAQADVKAANGELLILARYSQGDIPRLGLVIAKKNIRLAVQRNRIKRIIRETFRHQSLPALDILVLARKGADRLDNTQLHRALNKLWSQLQQRAVKAINTSAPAVPQL